MSPGAHECDRGSALLLPPGSRRGSAALGLQRAVKSDVIPAEAVCAGRLPPPLWRTGPCFVTVRLLSLLEACAVSTQRVMNLDGTSVAFVSGFCLSMLSCLRLCRFLSLFFPVFFFFFCQCDILAAASFGNDCGAC